MTELGTSTVKASSSWQWYLDTPTGSLFTRAYDAIGFFTHLAETGTEVWKVIDPVGAALRAGGNTAGWAAAQPSPGFLDSWGSGYVQGRYPGRAWTSGGPNLPTYQPALPNGVLDNGGALTISAPAAATAVRRLDVNADVVMVNPAAGAAGRISLGADRGRPARHHHGQLRRASIQPLTTGGPRSSPPGSGCRTATSGAACAGTSWSPVERPRRRRLGRRRCRLRRRPGRGDSGRGSNQR